MPDAPAIRLAELGRLNDAEADFNKAVELEPAAVEALVARARFHAQRGDVDRARTDFDAALKLAPTSKSGFSVGAVERELGRTMRCLWHGKSWIRMQRTSGGFAADGNCGSGTGKPLSRCFPRATRTGYTKSSRPRCVACRRCRRIQTGVAGDTPS